MALAVNSTGTVRVLGTNANWTHSGNLTLGANGTAALTIGSGGQVTAGNVIIARTPAYEQLPHGTKPLVFVRAAFELFAVFALNRPDCVAYFELRKGYVPKW